MRFRYAKRLSQLDGATMAKKDPEMARVSLSAHPYDTELFCPF
jgi:hypothetical protein